MGDREREERLRVVERCGREGDGGGTRETWDPKMATEASLANCERGDFAHLSSDGTPSRLLLGLKRHAYSVLAFFAQEMITT